jgi:hypothetical protein
MKQRHGNGERPRRRTRGVKTNCKATNEPVAPNLVTPAKAGVHHEPMDKLDHGAEDRDRLLRTKRPPPINTMDPGFRRGDGERGSHGVFH